MEARQISIDKFLSSDETRFIIPVYQRNYDWKEPLANSTIIN